MLRQELNSGAILATLAATMLAFTWGRWPDPVVDFGRELYVAWRLVEGDVLYRDIAYFNGPLSPHVNAMVFLLLGVSLRSLVIVNIGVIGLIATLLYRIVRDLEGHAAALAAGAVFILVFAFSRITVIGNYNYVTPYSHELTHGLVIVLALIDVIRQLERTGRRRALVVAGLALGLAFLTKPEIFAAGLAATLVGTWCLSSGETRRWRVRLRMLAVVVGSGAAVVVLAGLALASRSGAGIAWDGMSLAWRTMLFGNVQDVRFYRLVMGTEHLSTSLWLLARSTLWWTLLGGAVWLLARRRQRWSSLDIAAVAAFSGAVALMIALWDPSGGMRPLPLAVCAAAWFWHRRSRAAGTALAAAAFVLLGKVLFNAHLWHYGFALGMPATVALVALSISSAPEAIRRVGGDARMLRAAVISVWTVVLGLHFALSARTLGTLVVPGAQGADRFLGDVRAGAVRAAVDHLRRAAWPGATLAVLPGGVIINYLARLRNPTPYVEFSPFEARLFGEETMAASIRASRPDFVAVVSSDFVEYGYRSFADDFGVGLAHWIDANYAVATVVQPGSEDFRITIATRRERHGKPGPVVPGEGPSGPLR